jgi:hypothetical protein
MAAGVAETPNRRIFNRMVTPKHKSNSASTVLPFITRISWQGNCRIDYTVLVYDIYHKTVL